MAGSQQSNDDDLITGINVTPLVDVCLVLLIIFIVTAKHIVNPQALPMDLPKASNGGEQQNVFSIEMAANGDAAVDAHRIPNDEAVLALARDAHAKNPDLRAVIKADTNVTHGRVVHVMDLLKTAGVNKVAFGYTPGAAAPATSK